MNMSEWSSDVCSSYLAAEKKTAATEHHILLGVDQDRIGCRDPAAHREGDHPAIDLDRLLELVLEHLLHERPDVEFGELDIARPESALRQDERDPAVRRRERLAHAVADARHLDAPADRAQLGRRAWR